MTWCNADPFLRHSAASTTLSIGPGWHTRSVVSLELEHFRDALAGLEELVLRDLAVAVEVTLAEAALHFIVDLVVVQRFALEEILALRDAESENEDSYFQVQHTTRVKVLTP